MNTQFSGKPKSETILVAKAGVAVANAANAGENVFDPTSFVANILDGQLGIVCDTHNSATRDFNEYLDTTDDAVKVDEIRIVQGTPKSADISTVANLPYGDKELVKSMKIKAKNGIMFTAKVAKASSNDAWVIGADGAGTISAVGDSDYKLHLQFLSKRNDRDFSVQGNENFTVSYSTPDYTTLATAEPLDHLVQNLVYSANLNSYALRYNMPFVKRGNKNFVAFAINFAGGSGTKLGDIVPGTGFPAIVSNGSNVNFIPDGDFVQTITNIIANGSSYGVDGDTTIELVDLSTAGAADVAQGILLVALDHKLAAARDEIAQVKVRMNVGLEYGFNGVSTTKVNLSKPYEGEGKARVWQLEFDKRARLNIFTQQNRMYGEYFLQPPTYIDATKDYTAYIIESKDEYSVAYSHDSEYFHRLIILVPVTEQPEVRTLTVTTKSTGATNATVVLNGVSFTVPLTDDTAGTTTTTADTIRAFSFTGWTVTGATNNVIFTATTSGPKNGAFSLTHATAVGTFAVTTSAAKVTDATIASGLNTYFGQWLTSVRSLGKLETSVPAASSFFI